MPWIMEILLVIFVVLWTARLARNKGRSMLLWGALAAIPAAGLASDSSQWVSAFSMLPMLLLIFVPSRIAATGGDEPDSAVACPRCQHAHEPGPAFCTNCGWELAKPYASADAEPETGEPADAAPPAPVHAATDPLNPQTPEPVLAATQTAAASADIGGESADKAPIPAAEPGPAFTAQPLQITRPLTAAGMTERGLTLINQGRVREAVDQFTKAIALDPRYREAWASRARAYSQLGLNEKAAADRQQLEAI